MADNIYIVDQLATGIETITVDDDGSGNDWLEIAGAYSAQTSINLGWSSPNSTSVSASGFYFFPANIGHRLVVNGLIENARGGNGSDFIQGNEVGNILYGDTKIDGAGGNDVISGSDGKDTIYGCSGNDLIDGGSDSDNLFGNDGDDSLSGGLGADIVEGGAGADVMSGGGDYGDTISYALSSASVRISIIFGTTTTGIGGDAQGDQITGFVNVNGSGHNDIMTDPIVNPIGFDYNANVFFGNAGKDTLKLGGGNDVGWGGAGRDLIWGENNNDELYGGAAADKLRGGQGADQLMGGADADLFMFASWTDSLPASTGRDTISDFSRAQGDRIDLSIIDANIAVSGNNAFAWRGAAPFSGGKGELRWQDTGSDVLLMADRNGDKVADFAILVLNVKGFQSSDLIL